MTELQNGEKILPKVSTPEYGTQTLQTTDFPCDIKYPNVT